jgi:hypothetical protein
MDGLRVIKSRLRGRMFVHKSDCVFSWCFRVWGRMRRQNLKLGRLISSTSLPTHCPLILQQLNTGCFSKLSTSCILAINHLILFQINAHNILSTYICHNCLLHVSVFVTPSSGRPLRYFLKNVYFLQCCNITKNV